MQWDPQRIASLTAWYGKPGNLDPSSAGDETRVLQVQPDSTDGRVLSALQDLLDGKAGPEQVASTLASTVLSDEDPDRAWEFFIGHTCMAGEFIGQVDQQRLVEMLIHMVKLPYDLPSVSYPIAIGPGDRAFAESPNFGFTLGEYMRGPRQYVCNLQLVTQAAQVAAATRWRNISSFAAMCTLSYSQQALPRSADMSRLARWTLANALEYGSENVEPFRPNVEYIHLRDRPYLWAAAAASWIAIVGDHIIETALREPESTKTISGPL